MISRAQSTANLLFTIDLVVVLASFASEILAVRAGSAWDVTAFDKYVSFSWILSLIGLAGSITMIVVTRQKRFIVLFLLGLFLFPTAWYLHRGGETTPLPISKSPHFN